MEKYRRPCRIDNRGESGQSLGRHERSTLRPTRLTMNSRRREGEGCIDNEKKEREKEREQDSPADPSRKGNPSYRRIRMRKMDEGEFKCIISRGRKLRISYALRWLHVRSATRQCGETKSGSPWLSDEPTTTATMTTEFTRRAIRGTEHVTSRGA